MSGNVEFDFMRVLGDRNASWLRRNILHEDLF